MKLLSKSFILLMVFLGSLSFVSCGSDNNDDTPSDGNISQYLVGTYNGEVIGVGSETINISLKVEATGDKSIKCTFIGENLPTDLTGTFTSDIYAVSDNEIWGTAPAVTGILYYKKEKNLTFQKSKFSFQGTKQ